LEFNSKAQILVVPRIRLRMIIANNLNVGLRMKWFVANHWRKKAAADELPQVT